MILWCLLALTATVRAEPGEERYGEHMAKAVLAVEDELLAEMSARDPSAYRRLMRAKMTDHAAYVAGLVRAATMLDRIGRDPALAERWASLVEKQERLRELAKGYTELRAGEQAARRKQMEALAAEIFDLREAERRARIAELTARLQEVQRELAEVAQERQQRVDEMVEHLLSEKHD